MSDAAVDPSPVLPFNDPSRPRRLLKVGAWIVGVVVVIVLLNLLGVDVIGWLKDSGIRSRTFPPGYIVAGSSSRPARRCLPGSPTTGSCGRPIRVRSSSGRS